MTIVSPSPTWTEQTPYQVALHALQQWQWSVFPLDEEKKPPRTGGYHPDGQPKRLGWKRLQARRASPKEVVFWEQKYTPAAWAVITGAISGLVILDFDGEIGQETRARLGLMRPHVQTGSGGHPAYFQHPGWSVPTLNSKTATELGARWPGLDIRADGGYAAFCGSNTHGPYLWLRDPELETLDVLPEDLRRFLGLWEPPEARQFSRPSREPERAASETPGISTEVLVSRALHRISHEHQGRNNT